MSISIGRAKLEIIKGDISEQDTMAIVNAANTHLWMGAGVAGTIKRKGGPEIEREAVAKGPIGIGEAVLTSGGKLRAKYVIHAAGMGQDLRTDAHKIRSVTRNTLKLAEEKEIGSVSFPAIGTGVGGFSAESCAHIMLEETIAFLQGAKHLTLVRFVLFDADTHEIFKKELERIFSAKK